MLVYSNFFTLKPDNGYLDVIKYISQWIELHTETPVNANLLLKGISEKYTNGCTVISRSVQGRRSLLCPSMFCVQLTHPDKHVHGRRWIKEIGIKQNDLDAALTCTILVKTEEISTQANEPIKPTIPRIVIDLTTKCNPTPDTPGLYLKQLDDNSASTFLHETELRNKFNPIIVLSPHPNGEHLVNPEHLRTILVGLADVVEVSPGSGATEIEKILGPKHTTREGTITILLETRPDTPTSFYENEIYLAKDILKLKSNGNDIDIEAQIFKRITHLTNLPISRKHISLKKVDQEIFLGEVLKAVELAKSQNESSEYIELLEVADKEIKSRDQELQELQNELQAQHSELYKLSSTIESLKLALTCPRPATNKSAETSDTIEELRKILPQVIDGNPPLAISLKIIGSIFKDRVVILKSATNSAADSNFQHGSKAFKLLWSLADTYWTSLINGQGDAQAKMAFGKNEYAPKESIYLTTNGARRRTFSYNGKDILMLKHLKFGASDTTATTLRIHFEWLADERKIIIGHCGKHLDF